MQTFNPAEHMVFCRKYQQNLPKLPKPPFPNAKGEEIQNTVSKKAWDEWIELQTMLINEKHLSMVDKDAKKFIAEQRELFLDNGDYERPAGFKPKD
ncbi:MULTISPECIES: oxidative damage protection protein [Moraxella]|uniref:Probable Fe(2+)-trafficking protein n=1 Tax=Moraxella nasicaprae TaxID=2904122 RepID=A0ABY6F6M2_9GAMM|nr:MULTISPECIES: oxidative damage protection protein [Moraxella]MDO4894831.1 oxidative damage protection protein [Moraxella sp.]UXZ05746.1 oxidative damage protection protein [Moraxella nasicaprae]